MAGVGAILIFDSKILMLLRDNKPEISNPGGWGIIGGGVEEGETLEQAIKREIKEETNIEVKKLHLWKVILELDYTLFWSVLNHQQVSEMQLGDEGQRLEFISLDRIVNLPTSDLNKKYFKLLRPEFEQLIKKSVKPA